MREKAAKTAQEFYAKTDPENVARLRLKLIQAGYMDPRAVGMFFLVRFAGLAGVAVLAAFLLEFMAGGEASARQPLDLRRHRCGALAYFLPGLVLSRKITSQDAGIPQRLSRFHGSDDRLLGCGHERWRRVSTGFPGSCSRPIRRWRRTCNLYASSCGPGASLDDALKSLADRLSLDEVRSFATLLQQSKELGTSLSGALRVFSDEMRHKRMSLAEEKAHALPAKMSVPVTVCILPVVLMIAVIPIIVKMTSGH